MIKNLTIKLFKYFGGETMKDNLNEEFMKAIFKIRKVKTLLQYNDYSLMTDTIALGIINHSAKNKEQYYVSNIQRFMKISKPAVSQLINSLEKKELIERSIDNSDRRKFVMKLTKKGKDHLQNARNNENNLLNIALNRFGQENAQELISLLNDFADIVQEVQEENLGKGVV